MFKKFVFRMRGPHSRLICFPKNVLTFLTTINHSIDRCEQKAEVKLYEFLKAVKVGLDFEKRIIKTAKSHILIGKRLFENKLHLSL